MRTAQQALVAAIGVGLVLSAVFSAVKTFVLPRAARNWVTASVFIVVGRVFRAVSGRDYRRRDRVMALYAPVTLVALAITWLMLVGLGYTLMFWASGYGRVGESFWVSGSSMLTLGSAPLETLVHRVLGFTAAAIGLGLVALLIAYLPSLYSAFAQRERLVALLEVRAGSPASAVEMLSRFHRIGWTDDISAEWQQWERWFAEIDESHTAYQALVWLRSPTSERSWVVAAGTVLDAASLWLAAVEHPRDPSAALCIRSGYLAMRRILGHFGIAYRADPQPTDPISIRRDEFETALDELSAVGVPLRPDRDQAWRDYAGWRVNYDSELLRLAELTVAPYAPWTSDRSPVDHAPFRVTIPGFRRARTDQS